MTTQGHTESEKIRILYEDSLKDIRELTNRLETVAGKVAAASTTAKNTEVLAKETIETAALTFNGLARQEMKKAGDAAISALSSQVGKIAQRVAGDAAATERQRSFAWAAGSMAVFGAAAYGLGLALGSSSVKGMGWGYLTAIALGGGIVGGLLLAQVLFAAKVMGPEPQSEEGKPAPTPWKHSEFMLVSGKLNSLAGPYGVPNHTSTAVWDVLSGSQTAQESAEKHKIQIDVLNSLVKDAEKLR